MSTIKFNTWQNTDGTENYKCRAWVNFNGTGTVAIRESGNVASITDNGTGDYTVNFTNAMPDTNYVVCGTASQQSGGGTGMGIFGKNEDSPLMTTSAFRSYTLTTGNSSADYPFVFVSVFR